MLLYPERNMLDLLDIISSRFLHDKMREWRKAPPKRDMLVPSRVGGQVVPMQQDHRRKGKSSFGDERTIQPTRTMEPQDLPPDERLS